MAAHTRNDAMPPKPNVFRPQHLGPGDRASFDRRRKAEQPWRGWYNLAIWSRLRLMQLGRQPLCETCLAKSPSIVTAATVVHHKRAHKGDWALFIDPNNHASACKPCHDGELQAAEKTSGLLGGG
jgi:5-methylcytosine-specific restriction endonuclease McrA